jgi:hypothetical protein
MRRTFVRWVLVLLVLPGPVWAVEPAPALSDREIAERLTRLETRLDEGLKALRADSNNCGPIWANCAKI